MAAMFFTKVSSLAAVDPWIVFLKRDVEKYGGTASMLFQLPDQSFLRVTVYPGLVLTELLEDFALAMDFVRQSCLED